MTDNKNYDDLFLKYIKDLLQYWQRCESCIPLDDDIFKSIKNILKYNLLILFNIPYNNSNLSIYSDFNELIKKFYFLEAAIDDFMEILSSPIKDSFIKFIKTEKFQKNNFNINDDKEYQRWIEILEECYMDIVQSKEYIQSINKLIKTLADYNKIKQKLSNGLLQSLYIPTATDIDNIYKEILILKKQIKELNQRLKKYENNV